ncbi:predicted protein [Histoplasma capsulatum H143]|uniref:Uncharacterized protein n=1 Tax=Ajellomyces capsulatus (strain H143) TaxID=544712 RepID=C6H9R6_AJECH|nr:predicted protein [Histoplasma capsulatum H143]
MVTRNDIAHRLLSIPISQVARESLDGAIEGPNNRQTTKVPAKPQTSKPLLTSWAPREILSNLQEGRRPPGPYVDYVERRLKSMGAVAPSQKSQSIQTSGESQLELWTPPRWFGGSITKQRSRIALVVHPNSGTWNKQAPFHSGSLMAHGHDASCQMIPQAIGAPSPDQQDPGYHRFDLEVTCPPGLARQEPPPRDWAWLYLARSGRAGLIVQSDTAAGFRCFVVWPTLPKWSKRAKVQLPRQLRNLWPKSPSNRTPKLSGPAYHMWAAQFTNMWSSTEEGPVVLRHSGFPFRVCSTRSAQDSAAT